MKRIFSILCVFLALFSMGTMSGCSARKNVSDRYYDLTKKVIEKADEYLDYENLDVNAIHDEIEVLANSYPEEASTLEEELIPMKAKSLAFSFSMISHGIDNYDDILEKRNELAEYIGVKIRD